MKARSTLTIKVFRRSAFAPLRANADNTPLAGRDVLIADAPVTARVLSAFARRGAKADLRIKCLSKRRKCASGIQRNRQKRRDLAGRP